MIDPPLNWPLSINFQGSVKPPPRWSIKEWFGGSLAQPTIVTIVGANYSLSCFMSFMFFMSCLSFPSFEVPVPGLTAQTNIASSPQCEQT